MSTTMPVCSLLIMPSCGCKQHLQPVEQQTPLCVCVCTCEPACLIAETFFCFSSPDEKEGLAVGQKESSRMIEEAKEREAQLQNKLKALEQQVKVLTERDHEVRHAENRSRQITKQVVIAERHLIFGVLFSFAEHQEAEGRRGSSGQHEAAGGGSLSLRHAVQSATAARQGPRRHEGAARRGSADAAAETGLQRSGAGRTGPQWGASRERSAARKQRSV